MISPFKSHYSYAADTIEGWDSTAIGVYYCGFINASGQLVPLYIGKGTGEGGMRSRLLDHLRDHYWPEVTHFGFHFCDYAHEADVHEANEILRYKPRYNKIGK